MKEKYLLLLGLTFIITANAQIINIPDANFKAKLLASSTSNNIATGFGSGNIKIDSNNNGEIEANEASNVYELKINNSDITNLEGISAFHNLWRLNCSSNQLTSLNLLGIDTLNILNCSFNQITTLVYDSWNMMQIVANDNQLTSLDVSSSPLGYEDVMGILYLANNPIESIFARNAQPYQVDIDFRLTPSLTNVCCATQTNIDWFQFIADLQNVTAVTIDDSCLLQVEVPDRIGNCIYPNPVSSVLTIESNTNAISYSIYNTLGQSVLEIPKAQNLKAIDVSSLKTGNYFMKINSDKGNSSVKFVKL